MKKHFFSAALILVVSSSTFLLPSCKKDETEPTVVTPPTPAVVTNAFSAKVDGVEFVETILTAQESNGSLVINASKNSGSVALGLTLPGNVAAGTYNLSAFGSYSAMYVTGSTGDDLYMADPGTVTITSNDTENDVIKGTFSFTATPSFGSSSTTTYAVTAGSFTMNY